jgi:hypothetical protein
MTCEEIARRAEWNRIMSWLKPPSDRLVTTPQQRAVNHRTFALLRSLRQRHQRRTAQLERRIA